MPENATMFSLLPTISNTKRSSSATRFSTSSRNSSRSSFHSFNPKVVTPIRASKSAYSVASRSSSAVSSNFDSFSNQSIKSDLSCEDLTDYQQRRKRLKEGKCGKLFQNYFPEKVESPPEISEPSDDEPYETDLEEDIGLDLIKRESGKHRHEHNYIYGQFCEQLSVVPNNYFLRHGKSETLNMRYRYLNYGDATAMSRLIRTQDMVSKLNLSDNGIGAAAMLSLAELLLHNKTITELNLANNRIGTYGARLLKIIMQNNNKLIKIDISGNDIGEKGGVYCSHIIQHNIYVTEFSLGNNRIGDKGAVAIGKALGNNVTLEVLDISWNHIQLPGALAIAKGVKSNEQLKTLRIAMNGFGKTGTQALLECLPHTNIRELDLSFNRIGGDGAKCIADVIKKTTKLHTLKLNGNTLTPEGAEKILGVIHHYEDCSVKHLDLKNVTVDEELITMAENLKVTRNLDIEYSIDYSRRKSAREMTRSELEVLAAILQNNGVCVREVFDDVISANSLMRVEDFLYLVEMSDKCDGATVKEVRKNTRQCKNHRFILKDLLSIENERVTGDVVTDVVAELPEADEANESVDYATVNQIESGSNELERLWTPQTKTRRKNKISKSKRK